MDSIKRRLAIVSVVYWLLIAYITAALIWWFISLERQNEYNHSLKMQVLKIEAPKNSEPAWQELELNKLNKEKKRNDTKFIGEGLTFLLLILLGATYLYRLVKAQFDLQKQQQNFMMAVTHELKTPIAVVCACSFIAYSLTCFIISAYWLTVISEGLTEYLKCSDKAISVISKSAMPCSCPLLLTCNRSKSFLRLLICTSKVFALL